MIKKFIKYFKENYLMIGITIVSFIAILIYSLKDTSIWWDQAVYIGMGRFISTGGELGIWEMFRPPLFPLFYAFLFNLNIPLIFVGKLIVIVFSIIALWLVYLISELIKKGSGVFSSLFLLITPVFFYYTKISTTDIISMSFVLLTIYLFLKNRYILAGIIASLAFLLRFPQGLILLPMGVMIIYITYNEDKIKWIKDLFLNGLLVGLGFSIFVLPYLISNYILYGGYFEPLIMGSKVVEWSSSFYNFGIFYYVEELFRVAPFLFLSIFIFIPIFKKEFWETKENKNSVKFIILTAFIFMAYFFWQSHKELRYSLAFIPYLAILSGVSFYFILNFFKYKRILITIFILGIFLIVFKSIPFLKNENTNVYTPVYSYLKTLKGSFLSTTPVPAVFGEVKIISLFDSLENFQKTFIDNSDHIDGLIIKDCDIYCKEKTETKKCENDLLMMENLIKEKSFIKTFNSQIDQCNFIIYTKYSK